LWLQLVNVAGRWSVRVDWVSGDSVSGDVLSVVMGAVDWLKWGSCVVVTVVGGGLGGGPAGRWLLEGVLIRIALRRCRMFCMMLVAGGSFVLVLGCEAVVWRLVGSLMVCLHRVLGEKYIWMVVWDRRRRDLERRAGRASGGVGSCEAVLGFIGVGMLGRSWSCQMSQCSALQSCSGKRA
jgi:hypothetical protein